LHFLPPRAALLPQVFESLAQLHALRLVHGDVKPANFLVRWEEVDGRMVARAVLADMGGCADMLPGTNTTKKAL
jgi:serine/threonine protein kinase